MISTIAKMAATFILISATGSAFAYSYGGGGGIGPIPPVPQLYGGIGSLIDLNITSGSMTLNSPVNTFGVISFGAIGFDLVDGYGSHSALFSFLGIPWNVFTGNGAIKPFGGTLYTGGPVPSGTAMATLISVDLSAFSASWNGNNFNQGNSTVLGTYDSASGAFNATWSMVNAEGPFQGFTSTWSVAGVATAVPEASTYTMMLVGVGLVGSMAVRRRIAKVNSN